MKRMMNKLNKETSAVGMGCWAIGGEWTLDNEQVGWGKTDDAESLKAIEAAYENGIRLFDTAATYGVGHSERLVGKALKGKRESCLISTKFGFCLEPEKKNVKNYGDDMTKADVISHLKKDCEESLKRLGTDYIDIYFFHIWDYDKNLAAELVPVLEELVAEGKIRSFGWSTDSVELAGLWAGSDGYSSVQINFNIAAPSEEMIGFIEQNKLDALNRGPLAMGFLTGKYNADSKFAQTDVRNAEWVQEGFRKPVLSRMDQLKEVLTSSGRTAAQGALAWIWAKSGHTFPIPGIRTVKQAVENARAMEFGPLNELEMNQIEEIMGR